MKFHNDMSKADGDMPRDELQHVINELFDDVGGFDEDFFMYLEDVDLALNGCGPVRLPRAVASALEELTGQHGAR